MRALLAYAGHEHEVGSAKRIHLALQPRSFTVQDDGRGMGLDRDGYVAGMLQQLTAGSGQLILHGVGLAMIAMSSPMLTIESRRAGRLWTQTYSWGTAQGPVQIQAGDSATGTRITVTLASDAPEIDTRQVLAQVEAWRASHPDLMIEVVDEM